MAGHPEGCLVCGEALGYGPLRDLGCHYCAAVERSEVVCRAGHFVCDRCHALPAEELIVTACLASEQPDPLVLAAELMRDPRIKMHGPEHHLLVPAVLVAAAGRRRGEESLTPRRLELARQRASQVRGGFCGHHGACGAGIGVGIFVSLLLEATPLSQREWQLANLATAEALKAIADHGGPRCCKRDSYLAIRAAVTFADRHLALSLPLQETQHCTFHARNRECLVGECPFFPSS